MAKGSAAAKKVDAPQASAPAAAPEKKERKTRLKKFKPEQVIKILVDKNPKRPSSKSFAIFELYKNGMTVEEALKAGIPAYGLDYDNAHEFIKIV